jgi:hypothetical protein
LQVQFEFKIKIFGQNRVYGDDLRSPSPKTKNRGNNHLSRRFGKYQEPPTPIQSDHLAIADCDDTAFGTGTLTWQDPVHSWKAGPGEVMTVENLLSH